MQDLKTWTCGHCPFTIDIPQVSLHSEASGSEQDGCEYTDALMRILEHRWAHLVTAFEDGPDAALDRLCEDDSEPSEPFVPSCWADELMDTVVRAVGDEPVDSDDVTPVLEGTAELLRADLPRARRLWYPVNEDGGFNR